MKVANAGKLDRKSGVRFGEPGAPVLFPGRFCETESETAAPLAPHDNRQSCMSEYRGIPHLAKNERDAPNFLHAAPRESRGVRLSFKERRMKIIEATEPHRNRGCGAPDRMLAGTGSRR